MRPTAQMSSRRMIVAKLRPPPLAAVLIARPRIHDAETIVPLPAFDPYPNATAAVGATSVRIPPGTRNWSR